MKRLVFLAGFLSLALLTNLSFRVPTTVEAQAVCLTGTAPAFTFGTQKNVPLPGGGVLPDGDLFYLGANDGNSPRNPPVPASSPSPPIPMPTLAAIRAIPTHSLGFVATTPNAISTAVSCLDSIWDINFEVAGARAQQQAMSSRCTSNNPMAVVAEPSFNSPSRLITTAHASTVYWRVQRWTLLATADHCRAAPCCRMKKPLEQQAIAPV